MNNLSLQFFPITTITPIRTIHRAHLRLGFEVG